MPTFMINQVTKDLNHAGQEKLQHEAGPTALGTTLGNKRILESEKNRRPSPAALGMEMKGPEEFAAGRGGSTILGHGRTARRGGRRRRGARRRTRDRLGEDGSEPGPKRKPRRLKE